MSFLKKFKSFNDGTVAIILIGILAALHLLNVVMTFNQIENFGIWLSALLIGVAVVVALLKNKYWVAAFLLFLLAYSDAIGSLIHVLMRFELPNVGQLLKLILMALAACYLILVVIVELFIGSRTVDKKFSNQLVIGSLITAFFFYIYNQSFSTMLFSLLPVFIALLGGVGLSASLILVASTITFPAQIIVNTINWQWQNQISQIVLLIIGVLVFVFNLLGLIKEVSKKS